MKQILFTLLLFCTVGLLSCRKNKNDLSIKQYDDQQIKDYIAANGLTGMKRDLTTGDTTGMYYQILTQGTGKAIDYPDDISIVFTVKSFDGQFVSADTIINHVYNYLGHLAGNNLPQGLQLGLINILKNKGGRMRLLVPSHLGYGVNGFGSGSSSSGNRVAGNQSLDYYVNLINTDVVGKDPVTGKNFTGQDVYDDQSVKNYMTANNLSGYTKTKSGLWYKVTQAGSGAAITPTSIVTIQYTSYLFNGLQGYDQFNATDGSGATIDLSEDNRLGLVEGVQLVTPGAKLSLIMPSRLGFGSASYGDNTSIPGSAAIPVYSCVRYEMNIISTQ
jgi:FKBP-type peptidyl-prolyl cis-trans isomerase FkpA